MKRWNGEDSAAEILKDSVFLAAKLIELNAKAAWNSEVAASGAEAINNAASAVVKTIAALNSEVAKNTLDSTSNGIKEWWNDESKENEETLKASINAIRGVIAAMSRNASKYAIKTAGRTSNILNISDKNNLSSLGNPRSWIRFDRPHGNVNYFHININKAITGLKDPHIPISPTTAKFVGVLGKVAEKANDIAPILATSAMIFETYRLSLKMKKDFDHGTTRNTVEAAALVAAMYKTASLGAGAGASIGSLVIPGLGPILGTLAGGLIAGYYGGPHVQAAIKKALDHFEWDRVTLQCAECNKKYTWKKYEEIEGVCCVPPKSKL